ncbi:MAG: hypothetical protein HN348_35380, partial [Proteobacteria bacterium]|nr:hypothetical protein [Pseudomonadota bacterium]
TVAEVTTRQNEDMLRMAGIEEIVVGDRYAGMILGSATRNPGLVRVLDEILTTEIGCAFYTAIIPEELVGQRVADLQDELRRNHKATVISIEDKENNLTVNPTYDKLITKGDRVVLLGNHCPKGWESV